MPSALQKGSWAGQSELKMHWAQFPVLFCVVQILPHVPVGVQPSGDGQSEFWTQLPHWLVEELQPLPAGQSDGLPHCTQAPPAQTGVPASALQSVLLRQATQPPDVQ
jgi:hypothetical protein